MNLKKILIEKIPKNKNPNKIVNIVEKILEFNKQQKGKGLPSVLASITRVAKVPNRNASNHSNLKILTIKQIHQRLPTALAQVKACNTSEN